MQKIEEKEKKINITYVYGSLRHNNFLKSSACVKR